MPEAKATYKNLREKIKEVKAMHSINFKHSVDLKTL